jgi:hypothetical protein
MSRAYDTEQFRRNGGVRAYITEESGIRYGGVQTIRRSRAYVTEEFRRYGGVGHTIRSSLDHTEEYGHIHALRRSRAYVTEESGIRYGGVGHTLRRSTGIRYGPHCLRARILLYTSAYADLCPSRSMGRGASLRQRMRTCVRLFTSAYADLCPSRSMGRGPSLPTRSTIAAANTNTGIARSEGICGWSTQEEEASIRRRRRAYGGGHTSAQASHDPQESAAGQHRRRRRAYGGGGEHMKEGIRQHNPSSAPTRRR